MWTTLRTTMLLSLFIGSFDVSAARLQVTGLVTNKVTGGPIEHALVRVYKDGVKQYILHTGSTGRYDVLLDNNAHYVIRFSLPGHVTKCFTVDTHGSEWENDHQVEKVFVEMTLFPDLDELDLSFFDLPMGMARFQPMTGHLGWDEAYDERIRERVNDLMSEYERMLLQRNATASLDDRATAR
ncbi:MAG: carboxypeptidase regulatory-like domain-containing protein [Flavobacteriales bacterium]|nr:carboxypeptidase regulatory-like domain-containing protein [Flavobacteriales bacterium]